MEFAERLEIAHQVMAAKGVSETARDDLTRILLWRLGVEIPPPCFSAFAVNLMVSGLSFAAVFGGAMWLLFWLTGEITVHDAILAPLGGGLMYGTLTAALALRAKRKYGLPDWSELERPADIFD